MQYRLSTLFLLFVVLWSSLAVFGGGAGIVPFLFTVFAAIEIYRCKSFGSAVAGVAIAALVLLVLVAILLPAVANSPEACRRMACAKNMKQLVVALDAYCQANGHFPPAYISDKNGKPMHSWRVLILPFMQLDNLYRQYDFKEPWNGPNNRKLLSQRPPVYACPSDRFADSQTPSDTRYVALLGKHAAWQPGDNAGLDSPELKKHTADTVLLIEDRSGIAWTEPKDFSLDCLEELAARSPTEAIRLPHLRDNNYFHRATPSGGSVACIDGSTKFLPLSNMKADMLAGLLNVGGCDEDHIAYISREDDATPPLHWPHCFTFAAALVVWLVSVGWLFHRAVRSRRKAVDDGGGGARIQNAAAGS